MNKVILMGRLTKDPDVRCSNTNPSTVVARFTLAVDRRVNRENEPSADFISCVAFGKAAEFAEKYIRKGTKIVTEGRWQTGSYNNRDGLTVYTNDHVVDHMEFAESKNAEQELPPRSDGSGFMNLPEGIAEELPFN